MCAVFFFNDTATTEIYTLSLHDALPIWMSSCSSSSTSSCAPSAEQTPSTSSALNPPTNTASCSNSSRCPQIGRAHVLNSSHANISYAVFCLKQKNNSNINSPSSYLIPT